MPEYAQRNPEYGFWHAAGLLMKEGLVAPFKLEEMPVELYLFYISELESQAKYEEDQQRTAADKLKSTAAKIRRR